MPPRRSWGRRIPRPVLRTPGRRPAHRTCHPQHRKPGIQHQAGTPGLDPYPPSHPRRCRPLRQSSARRRPCTRRRIANCSTHRRRRNRCCSRYRSGTRCRWPPSGYTCCRCNGIRRRNRCQCRTWSRTRCRHRYRGHRSCSRRRTCLMQSSAGRSTGHRCRSPAHRPCLR